MIMQGFVGFRIPVWLRQLTIVPAFVVVGFGINVANALVLSQIVLSFVLPLPMIDLLVLSSKRSVMGIFAMRRGMLVGAACCVVAVVGLNVMLIVQVLTP